MERSCQRFVVPVATTQPFKMNKSESSQKGDQKIKSNRFRPFMALLLLDGCVDGVNQVKNNPVINKDFSPLAVHLSHTGWFNWFNNNIPEVLL